MKRVKLSGRILNESNQMNHMKTLTGIGKASKTRYGVTHLGKKDFGN